MRATRCGGRVVRQAPAERLTGVRLPPAPPQNAVELAMAYYDFDFPSIFKLFGHGMNDDLPRAVSAGLNIYETKNELVVEAPVPGVKKDEVTVEVSDGILKIDSVHQEKETEKKEKTVVYCTQRITEFHYSTTLPKEVKEGEAKAKLEDGVLKIGIPLKAKTKEKRATVPVEGE